jgi:hypothetical protein
MLRLLDREEYMKIAIITLITFVLSDFAIAQSIDSTHVQQKNGNRKQHRMDRFIDLDGDGICDHRSQGLGFRRKRNSESMNNSNTCTSNNTASQTKGKQYHGGKK